MATAERKSMVATETQPGGCHANGAAGGSVSCVINFSSFAELIDHSELNGWQEWRGGSMGCLVTGQEETACCFASLSQPASMEFCLPLKAKSKTIVMSRTPQPLRCKITGCLAKGGVKNEN